MNERSPSIQRYFFLFPQSYNRMVQCCSCFRRVRCMLFAKQVPIYFLCHFWPIFITDTPHCCNHTWKARKMKGCCKMHSLSRKVMQPRSSMADRQKSEL